MELSITEKIVEPTICLNMIVKNESHIIKKTLRMLCEKIHFTYWVICDTGSTDNTKELITAFFEKKNIPGLLLEHKWENFAHNRTLALNAAFQKTDFLFIFDADDEIHGSIILPKNLLDYDGYFFQFGSKNDIQYQRILLVNNRIKWNFLSVVHEYINCLNVTPPKLTNLSGNYYLISGKTGSRNLDPNKYLNDALILEDAWTKAKEENDMLYQRYAFYCANSYKDHCDFDKAIKWYKIVLEQDNWLQEKYISCLNIFHCYSNLKQTELGIWYLIQSLKYDSERVEGIYYLIMYYLNQNMHLLAYNFYRYCSNTYEQNKDINSHNKLFIENDKYSFFLPYYMIIICFSIKNNYDNKSILLTAKKMYEIVFTKKFHIKSSELAGNLLYNFQFTYDLNELTNTSKLSNIVSLLQDYCQFLYSIGHNLNDNRFKFLENYEKILNIELIVKQKIENIFEIEICKQSKNIIFYTGYMNIPWNYTYSLTNALGGSESAVINLAKQFPKNYKIYICGNVQEEIVDNLIFVSHDNITKLIYSIPFHTLIVSRYLSFYENYSNISFFKSFIWAHDTCLFNYGCSLDVNDILIKWSTKITKCICQTKWHEDLFGSLYPSLKEADKLTNINNGIDLTKFLHEPFKILNRFIYTSCAERGLNKLLELWPQISEQFPNAELFISSYNDFPRNKFEENLKLQIDSFTNIKHLGKLSKDKLYELMSSAEYWLYPTSFTETSCITAMEMLKSEVICLYYPIAGLIDTIGDYGIQLTDGNEIETLLGLTNKDKLIYRKNGLKYTNKICSWSSRFNQWNKLIDINIEPNTDKIIDISLTKNQNPKIVFYIDRRFNLEPLIDYFDSLNGSNKYSVSWTTEINDLKNIQNFLILFVPFLLETRVVEQLIEINKNSNTFGFFNTEPLNICQLLNNCLWLHKIFPSFKFYDYSLSNIKILNEHGITNTEHLGYEFYSEENNMLVHLYNNTVKKYDFGIISGDKGTELTDLPWRRRNCVIKLRENGFSVKLINGWKYDRDKKLAECKWILNIHGQFNNAENLNSSMVTGIFEHIRCNRLLDAGFKVLSEDTCDKILDNCLVNKYSNIRILPYENIVSLIPEHLI